ncbi:MAG: D-sedoheptulose 7-phosphate isomerase [Psittacicella sp.]
MILDITNELKEASNLLVQIMEDKVFLKSVEQAAIAIVESFKNGGKVLSCGNGGSHCDAMHFAEELTGRYRDERKSFPAISISDSSHITCVGNDYGYDHIFSRFIEGVGFKGDVLFCLSTSGNSQNVIEALKTAKAKGMKTIALTGKDGGKIKDLCDIEVRVNHFRYADRIQEIHIKVIHILIMLIEKAMERV